MLPEPDSRRVLLAWCAVVAGGVLAAASVWHEGRSGTLPVDAVARVGTQLIARAQWLRAVQAVETDRGAVLDDAGRRAVLQRLIDEELLYQHAVDSGLARDDPGLRKTLIAGLVDATTAGGSVDESQARALFASDPAYFAAQARLRVSAVELDDAAAAPARDLLLAALRDAVVEAPLRRVELPAGAVPLPQLAQRLGGSAADRLRRAAVGELIGPLAQAEGALYLMVLERQADTPRYEDVAEAVRSEWSRRAAEAALAQLLEDLRGSAAIRIADDAH